MMMNTMELDGFTAVIRYNDETGEFRGEIQGLNGGADFYGKSSDDLRREFRASLDFFIETCAKNGIEPKKAASGKLMLRVPPAVHSAALVAAQAAGTSLNQWAAKVLAEAAQG
jgi:predicted HicB family RNase H-like nuclease